MEPVPRETSALLSKPISTAIRVSIEATNPQQSIANLTDDDRIEPGTRFDASRYNVLPFTAGLVFGILCPIVLCVTLEAHRKLRGIPPDAVLLSVEEQKQIVQVLQGTWHYEALDKQDRQGGRVKYHIFEVSHACCIIKDNLMKLTGGVQALFMNGRHVHTNAIEDLYVPLKFWRGRDGTLYCDRTGTIMDLTKIEQGQVTLLDGWDEVYYLSRSSS